MALSGTNAFNLDVDDVIQEEDEEEENQLQPVFVDMNFPFPPRALSRLSERSYVEKDDDAKQDVTKELNKH